MLTGRDLLALITTAVLVFGGGYGVHADGYSEPNADDKLIRILSEWERRAASRKSLDVRFTCEDRNPAWNERRRFTGRVVLDRRGPAMAEVETSGSNDERHGCKQRLICTKDALHWIHPGQKSDWVWPIAEKNRGSLPSTLALPFFWNLKVVQLKERYRFTLMKEEAETWMIQITPLTGAGLASLSRAYLEIDRTTYLPRRYVVYGPDHKSCKDFRSTEVRWDLPVPADAFDLSVDGQKLTSVNLADSDWIHRRFQPEFLP